MSPIGGEGVLFGHEGDLDEDAILGASFLCPGTVVSTSNPNDLTNASWTKASLTATANNVSDPFGGTAAGSLTTTASGSNCTVVQGATISINTTYEISGYFKAGTGCQWMLFQISDDIANSFGLYFDVVNGVVGTNNNNGGGSISCSGVRAAGSGWYQVTFAGKTTAAASYKVEVFVAGGNGTPGSTQVGEILNYYFVGP